MTQYQRIIKLIRDYEPLSRDGRAQFNECDHLRED